MPLRKLKSPGTVSLTLDEQAAETRPALPERRNFWQTSLLLATSAALGGIAVAIWNRRTLAQMRQQADVTNTPPWES